MIVTIRQRKTHKVITFSLGQETARKAMAQDIVTLKAYISLKYNASLVGITHYIG